MSAAFVSTNVEFVQVNTQTNPGTIQLPNAQALGGRIITFKDITGSFQRNPLTLTTLTGNTFDDGTTRKVLRENFGFLKVASDGISEWNVIEGTQMSMYTISTLNTVATLSTTGISTSQLNVSTLRFNDTLLANVQSNVYTSSSLLYCGSQIVGGTRVGVGPTIFLPTAVAFSPRQISGLILWLDAADINVFNGGRIWYDKSGTFNHATNGTPGSTTMPTLTKWNTNLNAAQFVGSRANSAKTTNQIPAFNVSYFLVLRINAVVTPAAQQFIMINNVDGQRQLDTDSTGFPARVRFTTNSPNGSVNFNTNVGQGQGFLLTFTIPTTTSGTAFGYYNGSTTASASQTPLYTPATANSTHYFGSANGASQYLTADYGEILIYNTVLNSTQQQQVEGYLAWKWGLAGVLPTNHLYKYAPPLR